MVGQQLTHITYIPADYSLYSHHLFTSCQEIERLSRNEPWWQHKNMLTIHCATSHLKLMTTAQVLAPAHPKEEWAWHNLKITLSNIFHQWNKRCLKESKKGSLKAGLQVIRSVDLYFVKMIFTAIMFWVVWDYLNSNLKDR